MPNFGRFQGRHMGMGRLAADMIRARCAKITLTPELREMLKKKFGITDEQLDADIAAVYGEVPAELDEVQAENKRMLTPPKEDDEDGQADSKR